MPSIRITAVQSVYDAMSDKDAMFLNEDLRKIVADVLHVNPGDIEVYWQPISRGRALNTPDFNLDIQFSTNPPNPEGVSIDGDNPLRRLEALIDAIAGCLQLVLAPGTEYGIWPFASQVALYGFGRVPQQGSAATE